MNYWLFQGNPEYFNFEKAISKNTLDSWGVSHHKNDIQDGDMAVIWLTGKNRGVAGLVTIIGKPSQNIIPSDDDCWTEKGRVTKKDNKNFYVKIEILTSPKYFITPIKFFERAKEIKLKVGQGYQNTNYSVTEEQYQEISKLFDDRK